MLKDVQNQADHRQIPISKAGIRNLRYPISVLDRANKVQPTIALVNLYVDLPHHFKGTHMSRFVDLLHAQRGRLSIRTIGVLLRGMLERFACTTAHLEIRFPYFIEKTAPVSKTRSLMDYPCAFLAAIDRSRTPHAEDLVVEVTVPVSTLCPCSKAISAQGAHNQRAWITLRTRSRALVWIEELIALAEAEASSGLYALLKRADEKWVTERAYARPRFAEDMARGVALRLRRDPRILGFEVECESLESIHNHNAYARVCSDDWPAARPGRAARLPGTRRARQSRDRSRATRDSRSPVPHS